MEVGGQDHTLGIATYYKLNDGSFNSRPKPPKVRAHNTKIIAARSYSTVNLPARWPIQAKDGLHLLVSSSSRRLARALALHEPVQKASIPGVHPRQRRSDHRHGAYRLREGPGCSP